MEISECPIRWKVNIDAHAILIRIGKSFVSIFTYKLTFSRYKDTKLHNYAKKMRLNSWLFHTDLDDDQWQGIYIQWKIDCASIEYDDVRLLEMYSSICMVIRLVAAIRYVRPIWLINHHLAQIELCILSMKAWIFFPLCNVNRMFI